MSQTELKSEDKSEKEYEQESSSSDYSSEVDTFKSSPTSYIESEKLQELIDRKQSVVRQSTLGQFMQKQVSRPAKRMSIFGIDPNVAEIRGHVDPFNSQQRDLDQLLQQKRKTRNASTNAHFLEVGLMDEEGKQLDTQALKKKILTRALPIVSQSTQKQSSLVIKQEHCPKANMNQIYDKYFTKIIFNKKKSTGIENKLKIFDHLSSFVKSKQYLQNINKIYNMGVVTEQKNSLSS